MPGLHNPTVMAAAVIAVGMVLTGWLIHRGLKGHGRGLTELARALNLFSARLDKHNEIAERVDALHGRLDETVTLANNMDAFLHDWGGAIRTIPGIDEYLRQVDGERYLAAMAGGVVPPPQEPGPVPPADAVPLQEASPAATPVEVAPGQAVMPFVGGTPQMMPAGPNPKYPKLPFDPEDEASIEQHLASLLPEGRALDDTMPKEAAQGYGANYTWRQWACARVNMQFGQLLAEYGLPPLGSDISMTMSFKRMEIPGEPQND